MIKLKFVLNKIKELSTILLNKKVFKHIKITKIGVKFNQKDYSIFLKFYLMNYNNLYDDVPYIVHSFFNLHLSDICLVFFNISVKEKNTYFIIFKILKNE